MGISTAEIIRLHPYLYHMAEVGTWESIRDNGLLSTAALLDRFKTSAKDRKEIEERNRRKSVVLEDPKLGTVVIRDQIPMTDSALKKCLTGMTVPQWYKLLNSQVYLWTSEERLMRLFNARAYRGKTNCIITIDTKSFLERYSDKIAVSPINSGSTIFKPQPRGSSTFLPIATFPFDDWKKKRRSGKKAIIEVTVKYSIPDIKEFAVRVVHMRNKKITKRFL